ncbi:helix-turn-helix transcriptional regulator [Paenibacillus sp. F6_3S_P_1C]|uniref:Helix-turn-helix transcriptional regulator n=1 Tax=Paenibacillus vandeheii TaxID=3035917 RepID=A0ABT8J8L1_9BACL|nr:helix-turn-helix transcriptional regulator [Paenibacillus vandeheii]MDN4601430.1 helix-turn-helix transcriptional regulator [Paenibacillus vandeheii]
MSTNLNQLVDLKHADWITKSNIPSAVWELWERYKDVNSTEYLSICENQSLTSYETALLVDSVRKEINLLREHLLEPYLFILTDGSGVIVSIIGSKSDSNLAALDKFQYGMSMLLQNMGINSMSISHITKKNVYLDGYDHSSPLFQQWTGFCCPIMVENNIIGYLTLYRPTSSENDMKFALMTSIISHISSNYEQQYPLKIRLEKVLITYQFTAREEEVALLWLKNKSALYISNQLGISEGTVRNFIKRIYNKCGVGDRNSFFNKIQLSLDKIN